MADGRGVVFIAADVHHGSSAVHFSGYWDRDGHSDIEEMPDLQCAADSIAWGLERTDDVRIRFDGCGYWWAGSGSAPEPTEPDDEGSLGTVTVRR